MPQNLVEIENEQLWEHITAMKIYYSNVEINNVLSNNVLSGFLSSREWWSIHLGQENASSLFGDKEY